MRARRWTISAYRQSDDCRAGVGKVVAGDEFRTYGESLRVREDQVLDDDVDAVLAWIRVVGSQSPMDADCVRGMLSMVLGER